MRVIERKAADVEEARRVVAKPRAKVRCKVNKRDTLLLRKDKLKIDDLVLTYNVIRVKNKLCNVKFQTRWYGPYCISEIFPA